MVEALLFRLSARHYSPSTASTWYTENPILQATLVPRHYRATN